MSLYKVYRPATLNDKEGQSLLNVLYKSSIVLIEQADCHAPQEIFSVNLIHPIVFRSKWPEI